MKTLVRHMRAVVDESNGETYYMPKKDYRQAVEKGQPLVIMQNAGYTEALCYTDSGKLIASAKAECSEADTFSRKLGRTIAMNRLNKKLEAAPTSKRKIGGHSYDVITNKKVDYERAGLERLITALFGPQAA